jgi:hypothetical protein
MPQISEFFGISIYMYWNDHQPPHFHARYNALEAIVAIDEGVVLKGALPLRELKLVLAWAELHRDELLQNWERCRKHEMPARIEALQ